MTILFLDVYYCVLEQRASRNFEFDLLFQFDERRKQIDYHQELS